METFPWEGKTGSLLELPALLMVARRIGQAQAENDDKGFVGEKGRVLIQLDRRKSGSLLSGVLLHQKLAKGVKVCLVKKEEKDILDLTELS